MARVDPYFYPIPEDWLKTLPEPYQGMLRYWFENDDLWKQDMWKRTGGGDDFIADQQIKELYPWSVRPEEDNVTLTELFPVQKTVEAESSGLTSLFKAPQELNDNLVYLFPTPQKETRDVLSLYSGVSKADLAGLEVEQVEITANFTTEGDQVIICNNTSAITVTLQSNPEDGQRLEIKRRDALVTLSGTIDGSSSNTLPVRYDVVRLRYLASASEWMVM